jgi:hypothetical protein
MSYISTSDIKDNITDGVNLQDYILRADEEINDLAQSLGIYDTDDIETNPLHYKIRCYGEAFIIKNVCKNLMGKNDVQISDMETYAVKYNIYMKELAALKSEISQEMFTGVVNQIADRAVFSGWIFRS